MLAVFAALIAAPAHASAFRQEFNYPKARVYQVLLEVLPALKLKVNATDAALGRISAKAGMSAFSIGETLSLAVVETSAERCAIEMDGAIGATSVNAFATDRLVKHFDRIVLEVSRRLQAGA